MLKRAPLVAEAASSAKNSCTCRVETAEDLMLVFKCSPFLGTISLGMLRLGMAQSFDVAEGSLTSPCLMDEGV